MKLFLHLYLVIIFSVFTSVNLSAQQPINKDVKVGVVLSGGGAKGVAHVGVLRIIEKAGVRVDYIGGSSMGAIVAALYSVGYSVDQLDSIIRVLDMGKMVQGEMPREDITYFEKTYDSETFVSVPIVKGKIGLPQGLSNGQEVIDEFNALMREYPGSQDFNKLPIPLVIMATDIVTGESVEFHEGDLPLVMRASSSFPSLFAPVEINGRLLVDGGVMNNFPVKEVRNMGADIIIGVSVEDGLYKREDLTSMTSIVEQITSFQMVKMSNKQKELVDIYIKPDIKEYSVVSFDKTPEIIKRGEEEGEKYFNDFVDIANRQKTKKDSISKKLVNTKVYYISSVEVSGSENYRTEYFTDRFLLKKHKRVLRIEDIRESIRSIEGTRNFSFINYKIIEVGDSTYKIKLEVKEKENNEFLKIGFHYDNLYNSSLLLKYTARNKIMKSSVFMVDFAISDKPRFNILLFKDNAHWPGFLFQSNFVQFESDIPTSALGDASSIISGLYMNIRYKDWTTKVMAQKTLNESFYIGAGVEAKYLHFYSNSLKVDDGTGNHVEREFIFDKSWNISPLLEVYSDTRDHSDFTTKGFLLKGEFKMIFPQTQESDFSSGNDKDMSTFMYLRADYSFLLLDRISWTNMVNSSVRIGADISNGSGYSYFFGGYNKNLSNNMYSFWGYPLFGIVNVEEDGFFKYTTKFQYRVVPDIYLSATANYLYVSGNPEKYWYDSYLPSYTGYALTLGYDSMIGPVELSTDYSPETGRIGVVFNIGFWF